jgi:hypothetical protein
MHYGKSAAIERVGRRLRSATLCRGCAPLRRRESKWRVRRTTGRRRQIGWSMAFYLRQCRKLVRHDERGWSSGCYDNGCGLVYELTPNNSKWTEKVLHIFGPEGKTGLGPAAGLIFDKGGNLYATAAGGGTYHQGTVFEFTRIHGKWTEKVLYSFKGFAG